MEERKTRGADSGRRECPRQMDNGNVGPYTSHLRFRATKKSCRNDPGALDTLQGQHSRTRLVAMVP